MKLIDKFNRFSGKLHDSLPVEERNVISKVISDFGAEAGGLLLSYLFVIKQSGGKSYRLLELQRFLDEIELEVNSEPETKDNHEAQDKPETPGAEPKS